MQKLDPQLFNRISKYSAVSGALLVAGSAGAQIIYTDVNPDSTMSYNEMYNLDLNNDATPDFRLMQNFYSTSGTNLSSWTSSGNLYTSGNYFRTRTRSVTISVLSATGGNNSVAMTSSTGYVTALGYGANIGPSLSPGVWSSGGGALGSSASSYYFGWWWVSTTGGGTFGGSNGPYSSGTYNGPWGGQDRAIGLKINIGGNTHYGWARVAVQSGYNGFTIKEYAYEATPDVHVQAGSTQSFVGFDETDWIHHTQVFNYNNELTVRFNGLIPPGATLQVFDVSGRILLATSINGTVHTEPISNLVAGVYVVNIQSDEGVLSRKVYVK